MYHTPILMLKAVQYWCICFGKGSSNRLWSTSVHSCFLSYLTGQSCFKLPFVLFVLLFLYSSAEEDNTKCELQGLLGFETLFLTIFTLHISAHAIHVLLLLLTVPMYTMLSTAQKSVHAKYCFCAIIRNRVNQLAI